MLDHLQWRRAAVPRAHHRECSLCHHLLGNLPCCQMTKTKPLQSAVLTPTLNIRMFIYRQCNDALQEDCTATVQAELWWVTFSQEGITMATSTSPASLGSVRLRDRCFPHKSCTKLATLLVVLKMRSPFKPKTGDTRKPTTLLRVNTTA